MAACRDRPIRDIRFFERAEADAFMPDHAGSLYPVLDRGEAGVLGTRYALKLAERGFRTRGYDHVYVTLSPHIPQGEVRLAPLQPEPWFRLVDVGFPLEAWPRGRAPEQTRCLARAATRALERLCVLDGLDGAALPQAEAELLERGPELELTRLVKETAAGSIRVTFQVRPYGTPSPVFLEFRDHAGGRSGKIELLRVNDFEDVFPLIASAGLAGGILTLKPRSSSRAGLTTRSYRTPIRVPVSRILAGTA